MKRFFSRILILVLAALLSLPALAADAPTVSADGQRLHFDAQPCIIEGTTLVPLRALSEAVGAQVVWDAGTQTVTAVRGQRVVCVTVGAKTGLFNGTPVSLAQPARIEHGRTLVPLRFLCEGLGCTVRWDGAARHISVASPGLPEGTEGPFPVVHVSDGDTIVVLRNGERQTVRLLGVDAPESVHPDEAKNTPLGRTAAAYTRAALTGRAVYLEPDVATHDHYGRLLAYVYLDGEMFNQRLLRDGMAVVYTVSPNVKYADAFSALQRAVQPTGAGIWADWIAPTNFTGTYYRTKTGTKYHYLPQCGSGTYFETTLEEIARLGLTPCEKCAY